MMYTVEMTPAERSDTMRLLERAAAQARAEARRAKSLPDTDAGYVFALEAKAERYDRAHKALTLAEAE